MVKKFQGKVTIQSIQNEFDNLVDRINTMVDAYNASESVNDIDFSKGGTTLAPAGYTLTIGGLKQLMRFYDGSVFGCKVFRTDTNKVKVTAGLIITADAIYKTPEASTLEGQGTELYYDPDDGKLKYASSFNVSYGAWTQPVFSSNSTWGAVSATAYSSDAWKALNGVAGNAQSQATNSWWFYQARNTKGSSGTGTETLSFVFKQTLKCKSINIATPDKRVFALDKVEILDLDNQLIASANTPNSNDNYVVDLGNRVLEGIKLRCYKTSYSLLGGALPEFTLSADTQIKVENETATDITNWIKVADLNWNKKSDYLNDIKHVQSEGNTDKKSIRTQSRAVNVRVNEVVDTSKEAKFVCGMEGDRHEGQSTAYTYLLGEAVAWNRQRGHRNCNYWCPVNFLLVPKGVENPYTQSAMAANKVYKVEED